MNLTNQIYPGLSEILDVDGKGYAGEIVANVHGVCANEKQAQEQGKRIFF